MTAFDVYLNNRKLCRAGVGEDGVLDAIVTWVKLTGPAAHRARLLKQPLEETRLHVGGLRGDMHRKWAGRDLKVGDRVAVAVVAAKSFDPPQREEVRDPGRDEQRERRYYLRLKRKFEGPRHQSSARRAMARLDETAFLNVDLDIWSRSPLEPLVSAFGKRVFVLHVGKEARRYGAHLELAASGYADNPDQLLRRFVRLVKKLPRSSKASWDRAELRQFNVGIQAATEPVSWGLQLEPQTLDAIASVAAGLVVTVYGAGLADVTK